MALALSSVLLCLYTLLTCAGFIGLIFWISRERLSGVCG